MQYSCPNETVMDESVRPIKPCESVQLIHKTKCNETNTSLSNIFTCLEYYWSDYSLITINNSIILMSL